MATVTAPRPTTATDARQLVEMSWDPITRIVGSLSIYTKIDFANRQVAECHSTSSIFRGYSIFMKGKDPRDAHFITSRICGICGDNHATSPVITPAAKKVIYQPESASEESGAVPSLAQFGLICSSMRNFLAGVI